MQVHVFSNIDSCSTLDIRTSQFCGSTFQTPTVASKFQTLQFHTHANAFDRLPSLSNSCKNAIKKVLCRFSFPQCVPTNKTVIWYNTASVCSQMNSICGKAALNFTYMCARSPKIESLTTCVSPPRMNMTAGRPTGGPTSGQPRCPTLPPNIKFPKWILSVLSNRRLRSAMSIKASIGGFNNISNQCIQRSVDAVCRSVPYCSPDGTKLLLSMNEKTCESRTNCLPTKGKEMLNYIMGCSGFPAENSQQISIQNTQGYSGSDVNSAQRIILTLNCLLYMIIVVFMLV
ncbi:uncharacterized protein TRIADDRAFT_58365 [Trichoplax adhaerens]|uniref:FZ domain-containing protein n=1 Tax=Trichoplax adhaerens TaxID=10228 RepID=B3S1W7_TRIAD|nr:predicted protein [Trichoplax adhaerens]EDV23265.1 predicted protein [Trichoplax adhaerens]|eukprot:XP_002114175.1 predicted protein [Trichoplax adhaerens]